MRLRLPFPELLEIPMFTLTVPFPLLSLTLRVELVRARRARPASTPPPLTRTEWRLLLRNELTPHLLRDVGLDDSRE